MKKDIVILGGGPGGYTAAEMAVKSGLDTVIVEADILGGVCLNKGCIPTKTLYKEAELINSMIEATEHGVPIDGFQINIGTMKSRKNNVIGKLREEIQKKMDSKGIQVINGFGSIKDKNHVVVKKSDGQELEIEARYIIIATGSKPDMINVPGNDLEGVITCENMLDLDRDIKEVIIIGGGFIGVEMAGILSTFGISVKIVECSREILNNIDDDIRERLYDYAAKRGVAVYRGCCAKEIVKEKYKLSLVVSSDQGDFKLQADTIMISAGRVPVIDSLNLDAVGIKYDRRGIKVDETLKTNVDNIYAIGDVIGGMMLAHVASHQGKKVINNIMGQRDVMDYDKVPYCIYTFPEVAGVGLTEKAAKERGLNYKVGFSSFVGSGKAVAMGEADGFVKIICDEDETIVGVHILGPHASDVIHEGALAVNKGLKAGDIIDCIHAHPSLSECLYEAAYSLKK